MFSNLGNIFVTRPRHAENTDTRLDIRRHDPEQERRQKKDGDTEQKPKFDTYDQATVSVDALRAFLENFLKSLINQQTGQDIRLSGNTDSVRIQPEHARSDARASRAASMYQTAAHTAPRTAQSPMDATETDVPPSLDNEDVRTIHALLADLATLQVRRIEYLTIERGDTFLASLVAAVHKAKS